MLQLVTLFCHHLYLSLVSTTGQLLSPHPHPLNVSFCDGGGGGGAWLSFLTILSLLLFIVDLPLRKLIVLFNRY